MSDTPGEHLTEEPQSERGPMGSRDTGSMSLAAAQSTAPKVGSKGVESVDPQGAAEGDVHLPTGDTAAEANRSRGRRTDGLRTVYRRQQPRQVGVLCRRTRDAGKAPMSTTRVKV